MTTWAGEINRNMKIEVNGNRKTVIGINNSMCSSDNIQFIEIDTAADGQCFFRAISDAKGTSIEHIKQHISDAIRTGEYDAIIKKHDELGRQIYIDTMNGIGHHGGATEIEILMQTGL